MLRLKEMRAKTGLSQKDFANSFGIPFRTYQNWELYEVDPTNRQGRKPPEYILGMIEKISFYEENFNHEKTNKKTDST